MSRVTMGSPIRLGKQTSGQMRITSVLCQWTTSGRSLVEVALGQGATAQNLDLPTVQLVLSCPWIEE
jgi:hypothetical protein